MTTSEKLIYLRKRKGMTQEQLAEKIGVSRQALSKWETGDTLPDTINILSLSRLFGVTTDYLLNDDYDSDRDLPAVKENGRMLDGKWRRAFQTMIGAYLIGASLLALLAMGIIASIKDYTYVTDSVIYRVFGKTVNITYTGLLAMLHIENLMWLFWVLVASIVAGAGLILMPWLKKSIKQKEK